MTDDDTTHTPVALCWHCDRLLDAASPVGAEQMRPTPGAVSLCLYCGAVAIFTDALELRPPTESDLDALAADIDAMRAVASFGWARQYVMVRDSLMRNRGDPDR